MAMAQAAGKAGVVSPSAEQVSIWKSWVGQSVATPQGAGTVVSLGPTFGRFRVKIGDSIKLIVPTEVQPVESKSAAKPKASKQVAAKTEVAAAS
jgi:hypothetical protein